MDNIHNSEINTAKTRSVFCAILGQPNVGKSSLLNRLVGEKTAIVTPKPQTTRTRITGILTQGDVQYVFVDTPGFLAPRTKLGEFMTKTVQESVGEVDVALMLFEPTGPLNDVERELAEKLKAAKMPALAVMNKMDLAPDLAETRAKRVEIESLGVFKQVEFTSAETGEGLAGILHFIDQYAQEGPHFFPEDAYTDMPEKQLVAEIIREKLLLNMRDEIPHGIAVEVERFKERPGKNIIDIEATICCEKKSHKGMIIGKGGQMLKTIATAAREDCETMLGAKVHLQCWVKIRNDWRDDENFLKRTGFR